MLFDAYDDTGMVGQFRAETYAAADEVAEDNDWEVFRSCDANHPPGLECECIFIRPDNEGEITEDEPEGEPLYYADKYPEDAR